MNGRNAPPIARHPMDAMHETGLARTRYPGRWLTASMLLPSGSITKAP